MQQDVHPQEDDYLPPVSIVKLPSLGIVYPPESPLYLADSVDIKPVTAKEEDILSSPVLIKNGKVLSTLMRACITNRSIDPDDMLVGDRNAVLTAIRISAYGPYYNVSVTCPKCGSECDHSFDLSKLKLKTLDEKPVGGPGENAFSFVLPKSGKNVTFKLLDAKAIARIEKDTEAARKIGQEKGVTTRLLTQVIAIEGVPQNALPKAIQNLQAQDSKALRNYMDSIAPGVDMEQEFECPSCTEVTEVEIPIGVEFFWPSKV